MSAICAQLKTVEISRGRNNLFLTGLADDISFRSQEPSLDRLKLANFQPAAGDYLKLSDENQNEFGTQSVGGWGRGKFDSSKKFRREGQFQRGNRSLLAHEFDGSEGLQPLTDLQRFESMSDRKQKADGARAPAEMRYRCGPFRSCSSLSRGSEPR